MKTRVLLLSLISLLFSCNSDDINWDNDIAITQVLMLKVDYTTHTFEGGTEFIFHKQTDSLTIVNEYVEPADIGSLKLIYKELNEPLFNGTIHWMGLGKMTFPKSLKPADKFKHVDTKDLRYPMGGFENVFNPNHEKYDYNKVWLSVQGLVKVREYLEANPDQKAKVFLYRPSVGEGDPLDWDWVFYLKK